MEEILSVENKTILSGEYAKSDKNKWPSTLCVAHQFLWHSPLRGTGF
jgi:hypothetical protein